ncbi:MAG: sigma-70 family RNA polymerase sigma factor [Solirubrobacteraceae bacterium]
MTPDDDSLCPPSDLLTSRFVRGDVEAFEEIYRLHYSHSVSVARRYVRDAATAEDIAQESFIGLWRHRRSYQREQGSVRGWLTAITHHRAIDATRRARVRPQFGGTLDELSDRGTSEDVAHEIERRDGRRRVLGAIAALPAPQREVIGLSTYAELTHAEIARRTGTALGTVKGRSRLAMDKLRVEFAA